MARLPSESLSTAGQGGPEAQARKRCQAMSLRSHKLLCTPMHHRTEHCSAHAISKGAEATNTLLSTAFHSAATNCNYNPNCNCTVLAGSSFCNCIIIWHSQNFWRHSLMYHILLF